MSARPVKARTGRRPGEQKTREVILAAARRRFGEHGFAGTTIRMVASDVGVDPALVLHYFGNKADLFAAAVDLPVSPTEVVATLIEVDPEQLGEAVARTVVGLWEDPDALAAWLGLLRSAASDEAAATMLREFLTETILGRVAGVLPADGAERRVALTASQIVGLGVARYVIRLEPLATMPPAEIVTAVAPTLQRYLTGDLG